MSQGGADAVGHDLGRLDLGVAQVEHPEDDRLRRQGAQDGAIEPRLRRLDGDVGGAAALQLGQIRIATRLLAHGVGVAEAEVDHRRPGDPFQGAIDSRDAVFSGAIGPGLQIGLVQLDEVGAGGLDVTQLLVDDGGVRHREARRVTVVLVLRQRGQRERAGYRDLDRAVRLPSQERRVPRQPRLRPRAGAHRPRDRRRAPDAAHRRPRPFHVEPRERRRQPAEVALPAYLAVAHDIDAGSLQIAHGQPNGVVLGQLSQLVGHAPESRARDTRHASREQRRPVDEPLGLGKAADHGRGQRRKHGRVHGRR